MKYVGEKYPIIIGSVSVFTLINIYVLIDLYALCRVCFPKRVRQGFLSIINNFKSEISCIDYPINTGSIVCIA